jgi:hypothetical protein
MRRFVNSRSGVRSSKPAKVRGRRASDCRGMRKMSDPDMPEKDQHSSLKLMLSQLKKVGVWLSAQAIIPILVSIVTAFLVTRITETAINLNFSPEYPMIVRASQRPTFNNDILAVKIETDHVLKDVVTRLISISKNEDFSNPINGFVQAQFGWPRGREDSFKPKVVGGVDYIIIAATDKSADGLSHLRFFIDEHQPGKNFPELEQLRDLVSGTYYMSIVVLAENKRPAAKNFKLIWDQRAPRLNLTPLTDPWWRRFW